MTILSSYRKPGHASKSIRALPLLIGSSNSIRGDGSRAQNGFRATIENAQILAKARQYRTNLSMRFID
ncbi:hypothetical protein ACWCPQ_24870 [Nocardia sp. NPDC001965]